MISNEITADNLFAKIGRLVIQVERRDAVITMLQEQNQLLAQQLEELQKTEDE